MRLCFSIFWHSVLLNHKRDTSATNIQLEQLIRAACVFLGTGELDFASGQFPMTLLSFQTQAKKAYDDLKPQACAAYQTRTCWHLSMVLELPLARPCAKCTTTSTWSVHGLKFGDGALYILRVALCGTSSTVNDDPKDSNSSPLPCKNF